MRIYSEADLQSSVYYHLRRFMSGDPTWKVWNKYYIRRAYNGKSVFRMYPDIVLARVASRSKPRIAIELKERKQIVRRRLSNDAAKLYTLWKRGIIRRGFLIYLFRNRKRSSSDLQREISSWLPAKYHYRIFPIIINAYDHVPKRKHDDWTKRWNESARHKI
jgi:hypothetical protein